MKPSNIASALLASIFTLLAGAHAQISIDVIRYDATIHFNLDDKTIAGDALVTIQNTGASTLLSVPLKLRDLTVHRVEQDSVPATFSHVGEDLSIQLVRPLESAGETRVRVQYGGSPTAEPPPSSWGGFFFRGAGDVTFTMGVSFGTPYVSMTRHWLPSNDIPSDKAMFDLTYIVPNGYLAAGTGLLQGTRTIGNDSTAFRWVEDHPTATYLVTLAIAPYARLEENWRNIPMEYYVLRKDSSKAASFFATVPGMMECFTGAFGAYPFGKVGFCMTPIGAMEHQSMISYPQAFIEFYSQAEMVAAHELAHQWWGDWVTPADFREAWLSEGFATYAEALYAEHLNPGTGYWTSVRGFISRYLNSTIPSEGIFPLYDFPRTPPSSNYPGTIYRKGASVLGMLRHVVGDSAFFRSLGRYGARFAYSTATTEDLRQSMEAEHGGDLGWFFDQWVYRAGYPVYIVQTSSGTGGEPLKMRIRQVQDTLAFPLFAMPIDIAIITVNNDTLRYVITSQAIAEEDFTFPSVPVQSVKKILFDPNGELLKKVSYQPLETGHIQKELCFSLHQHYPNPVRMTQGDSEVCHIVFTLSKAENVSLKIYDMLGRTRAIPFSSRLERGYHDLPVNIGGLPCGSYFYLLSTSRETAVGKLLIER